jgi:PRTRC genetic system protein E
MNHFTNFFSKLSEYCKDVDVTLRIKEKNGKYTLLVQPEMANANQLKPLSVTGTPEDLDNGFFALFQEHSAVAGGLKSNLEEVKEDAGQISKERTGKKDKGGSKPSPAEKKGKLKPTAKKGSAKKKETGNAGSDDLPDIFSQGPAPVDNSAAAESEDQEEQASGEQATPTVEEEAANDDLQADQTDEN